MTQLKVSLENIIPLTEARDHFSSIVSEVQKDKLYVLTKGGKPAVAIIDVKYLETISGGSINTGHVEDEIKKDPAKVGRVPMIKHETKPKDEPLAFPTPPNFGVSDPKPISDSPKADDEPLKVNFQPETKPAESPISASPLSNGVSGGSTDLSAAIPPAPPTPPVLNDSTIPAAQTPAMSSSDINMPSATPASSSFGNIPISVNSTTPAPTTSPIVTDPMAPPATIPSANPITAPQPSTPSGPVSPSTSQGGSTIDVTPSADLSPTPSIGSVAPDDKAGPAQYAGGDDLDDMEI